MTEYAGEILDVVVDASGTTSAAFTIPKYALFCGAVFPAMDDGAIGLELTLDNSTYVPIIDPADGQDLVLAASTYDPCFIDFSDFVRAVPRSVNRNKLRFTCAAQVSGAVTINVTFK